MKKVFAVILLMVAVLTMGACDKKKTTTKKFVVEPDQWVKAYDVIVKEDSESVAPKYAVMQVKYTTDEGDDVDGTIKIRIFESVAPKTSANFIKLVNDKFYDGLNFYRIIDDFMIQGGDPTKIDEDAEEAEKITGEFSNNNVFNSLKHTLGVISMARTSDDMNSASSSFFICESTSGCSHLDGDYAAFGVVVSGIEHVHAIAAVEVDASSEPVDSVTIVSIRME